MKILSDGGDLVAFFKEVIEGEKICKRKLTAVGARALNRYRYEVARGERPSVVEILMAVSKVKLNPEEDEETFPGRQPWGINRTEAWVALRQNRKKS